MKVPLSVIIITKNEESRIKDCINSVKDWADEVIVVDDYSQDKTRDIACSLGAKVFLRRMDIEGRHRNWANSQARNEWILSLDADERVTPQLKEEISQVLKNPQFDAYTIPRKNFFHNYWIRYSGQYPSSQLKLFKKDKLKWEEAEVHPRAFMDSNPGRLKNPLLHFTYKDFSDMLYKLNKQTTLEAIKWAKISEHNPQKASYKMNLIHALWRTLDRFIRVFIVKKGYKDGFIGFIIALNSSLYQIISYIKYWEIKKFRK